MLIGTMFQVKLIFTKNAELLCTIQKFVLLGKICLLAKSGTNTKVIIYCAAHIFDWSVHCFATRWGSNLCVVFAKHGCKRFCFAERNVHAWSGKIPARKNKSIPSVCLACLHILYTICPYFSTNSWHITPWIWSMFCLSVWCWKYAAKMLVVCTHALEYLRFNSPLPGLKTLNSSI